MRLGLLEICISSGVLRWMIMRRFCGGSGPILMGDLLRSVRMWPLGLRSCGVLSFCSCCRRSAVALLSWILLAVDAMSMLLLTCVGWSSAGRDVGFNRSGCYVRLYGVDSVCLLMKRRRGS